MITYTILIIVLLLIDVAAKIYFLAIDTIPERTRKSLAADLVGSILLVLVGVAVLFSTSTCYWR